VRGKHANSPPLADVSEKKSSFDVKVLVAGLPEIPQYKGENLNQYF
jgi:hypothetical protein